MPLGAVVAIAVGLGIIYTMMIAPFIAAMRIHKD